MFSKKWIDRTRPVGWGCRVHQLYLCTDVRVRPNVYSGYDTQLHLIVRLLSWAIPSLRLFPGLHFSGVVIPEKVPSAHQIIIIIMSCHRHGYPWPSLATSPNRSSPLAGLLGYIPYPHIAAGCMFELVVLLLSGHRNTSLMSSSLLLQQWPACLKFNRII